MTFGEFVKEKRQKLGITLRAFADELHIAPSYVSDIEKGKRNAPTQEILEDMSRILQLTIEDKNTLYDLAAESKNVIAKDITQYVSDNKNVRIALRRAKELNLGEEEWLKIIDEIINKKRQFSRCLKSISILERSWN